MKVKLVTQNCSDRNRVQWIHSEVAWHAARGIAANSHSVVLLYGKFGLARFDHRGGGIVEWNEQSTMPGKTTEFDERTIVCIN